MTHNTTLQIITNVEAADVEAIDGVYTRGWIVPAGTPADADLELEAVDHVDIPLAEDETERRAGLIDALVANRYALAGDITRDGTIVRATVRAVR